MSPYLVSGANLHPPNVFLDIIGANCVSAGRGKVDVIFYVIRPKSGRYGTPHSKSMRTPYPRKLRLCKTACLELHVGPRR